MSTSVGLYITLVLVGKRPKLAPAHQRDAQTDAKLARIAEVLADPEAVLLAEDECDAQLLAVLRAMWQRIGAQVRTVTPGQNAKRGIFGALNLRSGVWFYRVTIHKRSTDFIAFLTQILAAYPTGQIFMLVDNVSIHASKLLQIWLA